MNLELFVEELLKRIKEKLKDCKISVVDIYKNNGVILKGFRITKEDSHISPTIYLEQYFNRYNQGEEIDTLAEDMVHCYQYAEKKSPMNVEQYTDFEKIKDRIVYKLINQEKNQELLKDTPYIAFLDLAVVFYYICENYIHSQATILIRDNHLLTWGKSKDEIFKIAVLNTPKILKVTIRGMQTVIHEMLSKEQFELEIGHGLEIAKEKDEMYVLTNQNGIFGAACILYSKVLESFSKKINCDFYILPSSVHEVILVPKNKEMGTDKLKQMVREVNETEVLEEEILSNNVYYYSYAKQKFTIA